MIDNLPRIAHGVGKRVLFLIVDFPLAAVIKLDQMTERAARNEELPFRILTLGFRRQGLGQGAFAATSCDPAVSAKVVKIKSILEGRKGCRAVGYVTHKW